MFFTRSPVVCDDIEHDSRIDTEFREYLASRACKKFLAIPTFVSGGVRGFIGIHHTEQGAYRAEEIELAQALAHHVMIAVHEQELAEQHRQAAILNERTRMARDLLHDRDGTLAHECDGHGWERTPWHATQRAAWEALRSSDSRRQEARLRGNGP